MSRAQLGEAIGVGPATIGRYERGQWAKEGPKRAALEAIGRATQIHTMLDVFGEPDSVERFATATRREAELRYKRPEPGPGEQTDEDDPGRES
jgi:transcriptional regulator with XRE-family HTH domain